MSSLGWIEQFGISLELVAGDAEKPLGGNECRNLVALAERFRELAVAAQALADGDVERSRHISGPRFRVTEQTVKYHLTNIDRKLNVKNRTEATRFAYQHGLLEPPPPRG